MFGTLFKQFMEFTGRCHLEGKLSGDRFSRLPEDWDYWLACLAPEDKAETEKTCAEATQSLELQEQALATLRAQESFSNEVFALVLYQLSKIPAFKSWGVLEPYHHTNEKNPVIQAPFLLDNRRGVIFKIKAIIIPLPGPAEAMVEPRVLPLDFRPEKDCSAAMVRAGRATAGLLGWRGLMLLIAYTAAGHILLISGWRALRLWRCAASWRHRLASSAIYISVDGPMQAPIGGGSIALATCLAILLALYQDSLPSMTKFRSRVTQSAFTGDIERLNLVRVTGVARKVEAMERHGCEMGFLPAANQGDATSQSVQLWWCRTFPAVLVRLLGLRKSFAFVNALILLIVTLSPPAYLRVKEIGQPIPILSGFEDSYGFTDTETAAAFGFKIRQTDRITIYLPGDADDGGTQVKVATLPDNRGSRSADLKTIDAIEDWHSEITLAVHQQHTSFDYSQGREAEGGRIEIRIVRNHNTIRIVPLVLNVTPQ